MPISRSSRPLLLLSMGDPCGIGPEIAFKAAANSSLRRCAEFLVIGDAGILRKAADAGGSGRRINAVEEDLRSWKPAAVNIYSPPDVRMKSHRFGRPGPESGRAAVCSIIEAHSLLRKGIGSAIVTAPIHKAAAHMSGFPFPGHTEFLAHLSGSAKYAMMLCGGPLKVTVVTRHVALKDVPKLLTVKKIDTAIDLTCSALRRYFGLARPRIGVAALNPHAGEGGAFGSEEEKIIAPAVRGWSRRAGRVIGPVPADALFYMAYRGEVDAVVCMYHDQGLIPLKMIARDTGVNVTLGLDFIRTSPDHGTACDIAGKNTADPSSMEEAVRLAAGMAS